MRREIKRAVDVNLNGLRVTQQSRAAIYDKINGGKKMKKKLSASLVLAAVLALLTVTALAVTQWETVRDYLETVNVMEREGAFDRWALSDKLALVEAMRKADIPMDEAQYEKLTGGALTEQEQEAAADAILAARYGEDLVKYGFINSVSIMEQEYPGSARRSSVEAARAFDMWYDQLVIELEKQYPTAPLATMTPLPQSGDGITREQALDALEGYLTEVYGFQYGSIDRAYYTAEYYEDLSAWIVSYAVTEQNPGLEALLISEIEKGVTPRTMLDALRERPGLRAADSVAISAVVGQYGGVRRVEVETAQAALAAARASNSGEIPREMAVARLQDYLTGQYGFQEDSIDPARYAAQYRADIPAWVVTYTVTEDNPGLPDPSVWPDDPNYDTHPERLIDVLRVDNGLTRNDDVVITAIVGKLGTSYGDGFFVGVEPLESAIEQYNTLLQQANEVVPAPEISEEDALATVKAAIGETYGLSDEELALLRVESHWCTGEACRDVWYFELASYDHYSENNVRVWSYAARVNCHTGELLALVDRDHYNPLTGRKLVEDDEVRERMRMNALHEELYARVNQALADAGIAGRFQTPEKLADGTFFYAWPLQDKADFSAVARPVALAFYEEYPELLAYVNREEGKYNTGVTLMTLNAYGMPDRNAIAQDRALAIAKETAYSRHNAPEHCVENKDVNFYYDVTDPAKPVWKVWITMTGGTRNQGVDPWGYFVAIDAYTGDVLWSFERTFKTSMCQLV